MVRIRNLLGKIEICMHFKRLDFFESELGYHARLQSSQTLQTTHFVRDREKEKICPKKNWHNMPPRKGEWVRGKMIGSGSFAAVHLAINNTTRGLFVLKPTQSEAGLRCLEKEAEILENLNSPNIVKGLGREYLSGKKGGNDFNLFLEYLAGGNLSDAMEKFEGKFDEKVIHLYMREILMGLKYIHESGIVHFCDLKCKNVLSGTCGRVKLADFGSAKRKNEMIPNGFSVAGTPLWMAPEVLRKEKLDFSTDIRSLGCTVIEMGTGRPP